MKTMAMLAFAALFSSAGHAAESKPWRSNVAASRAEALKAGKPCVLFLNVDASAL